MSPAYDSPNASAIFSGQEYHTYRFYALARDGLYELGQGSGWRRVLSREGARLTLGTLEAQVEQAEASAELAQANLRTLTQNIMVEVEQAYLGVAEAQERMGATTKLVEQAEQNLNLAERQYAAGVGTALDVTDAQLTRSNAQITNIQAIYDYNSSLARLQRAIGIVR